MYDVIYMCCIPIDFYTSYEPGIVSEAILAGCRTKGILQGLPENLFFV